MRLEGGGRPGPTRASAGERGVRRLTRGVVMAPTTRTWSWPLPRAMSGAITGDRRWAFRGPNRTLRPGQYMGGARVVGGHGAGQHGCGRLPQIAAAPQARAVSPAPAAACVVQEAAGCLLDPLRSPPCVPGRECAALARRASAASLPGPQRPARARSAAGAQICLHRAPVRFRSSGRPRDLSGVRGQSCR